MYIPVFVIVTLMVAASGICLILLIFLVIGIMDLENERIRRNRRVIPNSLIRIRRIRQLTERRRQYEMQHLENQQKVNEQIKDCIIIINPDQSVKLGYKSKQTLTCAKKIPKNNNEVISSYIEN